MKKIIFQCAGVWLAVSLLVWWLFFYSPLDIPHDITVLPDVPSLSILGLVLVVLETIVLRFFLKRYLRQEPEAPISELTSIGLLSVLLGELVFQMIRQFSYADYTPLEHFKDLMVATIGMPLFAGAISLSIAARLKKNKNRLIPVITTSVIVLVAFVYRYLKSTGVL